MKNLIIVLSLVCSMTIHASENDALVNEVLPIPLSVQKVNPTPNGKPFGRMPVAMPELFVDGHTLYLNDVYTDDVLQILQDGEVVFQQVLGDSVSELVLPTTFEGEYEIQIIRGNYCFFGYITL
ncbi:MAG: hypothetical protein IJ081_00205 [Prevotella sp.]|nr:hypothetical protein [Prevotella sp.]